MTNNCKKQNAHEECYVFFSSYFAHRLRVFFFVKFAAFVFGRNRRVCVCLCRLFYARIGGAAFSASFVFLPFAMILHFSRSPLILFINYLYLLRTFNSIPNCGLNDKNESSRLPKTVEICRSYVIKTVGR